MTKDILDKIGEYTKEENNKYSFCSILVYLLPYDKNRLLKNYKNIKFPSRNIYKTELVRSAEGILRVSEKHKKILSKIPYDKQYKKQLLVFVDYDGMKADWDRRITHVLTGCNKSHWINIIVVTSELKNRGALMKIRQNCGEKVFVV